MHKTILFLTLFLIPYFMLLLINTETGKYKITEYTNNLCYVFNLEEVLQNVQYFVL